MTDPIRWDDPASLELFNKVTGETAPVVPWMKNWPDADGDFRTDSEPDDAADAYYEDGQPNSGPHFLNWIIRNKSPQPCCDAAKELAELREAAQSLIDQLGWHEVAQKLAERNLSRFIQPEPVKVDPLVEAIREMALKDADQADADRLRAALAKRGLTITEGDAK